MTDVELIKSKIDVVSFISEHVPLKKIGRHFKARCPFHSEKTPSFVVSPERQSWHCFGACNTGGDVISFLQKWENLDFVEALKILAQKAGVTLSSFVPTEQTKTKELLYEINHLASEYYHFLLTSHPIGQRALEYVSNRAIRKEIIETFVLGYAPNSWDSVKNYLSKKGYRVEDMVTAGLLVKSERGSYYDRFRGRLMFTLKDHRGNVVGFSGRKLPEQEKSKTRLRQPRADFGEAKYVNTSDTPVYVKGNTLYGLDVTKESIRREHTAIIVEGEFDMLSSFQSGVTNVVAIKGSALTDGHIALLKRYADQILLALDSDFAGNEAARRGIEMAETAGLTVRVVVLPTGKDPADCIREASHLWKDAVKKAIPIYDFILDTALAKYDKRDVVGKRRISDEVMPYLAKITNPIIVSHYIRRLARELDVSEESIQSGMTAAQKKQVVPVVHQEVPKTISREIRLEEHVLALVVQAEDVKKSLDVISSILVSDDFTLLPVATIIERMVAFFRNNSAWDVKSYASKLPPEVLPTFDRAYLTDIIAFLSNPILYNRELLQTARDIRKLSLRRRAKDVSTKIQRIEEEKADSTSLHDELLHLLSQIREVEKEKGIGI